MVLVFKTSVETEKEARFLKPHLDRITRQQERWNFDLEDCDNILRIESQSLSVPEVIALLNRLNFYCEELEDIVGIRP